MKKCLCRCACWLFAAALSTGVLADDAAPAAGGQRVEASRLRSADDGAFDISAFVDEAYGFVPLAAPITEPAVGLGAVGALVFIDKPKGEAAAGFGRPNISVIGALGTDNGTRGAFAGDLRHWQDDRLKTLAGFMNASVNLTYYGIGNDPQLQKNPRSYNLETKTGMVQGRYRIGDTQAWVGIGYALASTTVKFDFPPAPVALPDGHSESRVGGLLPSLSFDSRDNIFTPTSGTYLELSAGLFSKALGGDSEFRRVNLTAIHYQRLNRELTLGVMGNAVSSTGDVPFYLRPYLNLRGLPALRYQGDNTAQIEAELRWQFWQRYSLVGFAGAGATRGESGNGGQDVSTRGFGFRYEIARKHGLHVGIDVAYGPDERPAYYLQFGSAWSRP